MAQTKSQRNALRRLQRILEDEDYGPKLARLNRADERRVLDLIEKNRGSQARSEILRLDATRRSKRRTRDRERRARKTTRKPTSKGDLKKRAVTSTRRLDNRPKYKDETVVNYVNYKTIDELRFTVDATKGQLEDEARLPEYRYAPDLGYEINPFWYHLKETRANLYRYYCRNQRRRTRKTQSKPECV